MAVIIQRIQFAKPISFNGKTFESLSLGKDGKDRDWTCRFVDGGVHVIHTERKTELVCFVPHANILNVAFEPDAEPKPAKAKKVET